MENFFLSKKNLDMYWIYKKQNARQCMWNRIEDRRESYVIIKKVKINLFINKFNFDF